MKSCWKDHNESSSDSAAPLVSTGGFSVFQLIVLFFWPTTCLTALISILFCFSILINLLNITLSTINRQMKVAGERIEANEPDISGVYKNQNSA